VPSANMSARMEKCGYSFATRIDPREIRSLVSIAEDARQGPVFQCRGTAVALGNDVLQFERQVIVRLGHVTVLTPVSGSEPDKILQRLRHVVLTSPAVFLGLFERYASLRFENS